MTQDQNAYPVLVAGVALKIKNKIQEDIRDLGEMLKLTGVDPKEAQTLAINVCGDAVELLKKKLAEKK